MSSNVQKAPAGNGKGVYSKNKNTRTVPRKGSSLPCGGMSGDSRKANAMAQKQKTGENLRGEMI